MQERSILLIISGSIAAYKSLDLIRRLRERSVRVRCILTAGGVQFITPLSVASLTGEPVYGDLFSLSDETEMGHIRLTREADLVVVAPASADLIAKMAAGLADDLATAALLANDKPVLVAPAMNAQMWKHAATQRNLKQIRKDGAIVMEPGEGLLACGETGQGRMAEPDAILTAIETHLGLSRGGEDLRGIAALVTSGPTHEAIDPVRFLGNHSSGRQGHAIAAALAARGARVTLITGPVNLSDPAGVTAVHVTSAEEMRAACERALPVNVAVCAAAVSDWRPASASARKLKKRVNAEPPLLALKETPDILALLSKPGKKRPALVVGFAAETENLLLNARVKRKAKGCDWIVANEVSGGKAFGAEDNTVTLVTPDGEASWKKMSKQRVAEALAEKIAVYFATEEKRKKA